MTDKTFPAVDIELLLPLAEIHDSDTLIYTSFGRVAKALGGVEASRDRL
jgi:hypothetical protein